MINAILSVSSYSKNRKSPPLFTTVWQLGELAVIIKVVDD